MHAYSPREISFKDPLIERMDKLEGVLARLAKDYYSEEGNEPTASVGQLPELTRLQRENAELKTKFEAATAEARRWKEAAQRHIAVLDNIVTISEELSDATRDYR